MAKYGFYMMHGVWDEVAHCSVCITAHLGALVPSTSFLLGVIFGLDSTEVKHFPRGLP